MLTKLQNLRNFQVDKYIVATVGALLVAASSLKLVIPMFLIILMAVFGWRKVQREAFILSAPILVFASYQYLQLALRPESLAYYGDLANVYLVVLCVAIPYVNMFLTRSLSIKTFEVGVFFGSWATMIFWGFYQFAYDGGCRIEPFGINALFIPTTLLPLTYFFIALRFQEGRSTAVDSLTIVATLFCVISYTGSRMPLYTLVFALVCIWGYLIYNRKTKIVGLILSLLGIGFILAFIQDSVSGCNFFHRVTDQLDIFTPSQTAISEDFSTWSRWAFYSNSLNFLISDDWNWIIGNGSLAEGGIVNQGLSTNYSFTHTHNQYLSWLIASGVLGLCSGLLLAGQLLRHIFSDLPTFIFLILLGLPFLTNSPMYNAPITAQILFLMLTMQILSFVRHGKEK